MKQEKCELQASLENLMREMHACNFCEDYLQSEPNPIFQLSCDARIFIVGQAPGLRAHLTHLPFNDSSGNRLRQWLGVTNEQFYNASNFALLPMGLCYPGVDMRGADRPPCQKCARLWHPQVKPFLKDIKLIILVGQYAHAYYLQKRKKPTLTQTVAAWREYLPDFIPLPHPSWRNIGWIKKNPWFVNELLPSLQERIKASLA